MKVLVSVLVLAFAAGCSDKAVDVGAIDQKEPPAAKELTPPKSDDGIGSVGLRSTVTGTLAKSDRRRVYVLVNPLSNKDTQNVFWVQEEVTRGEATFSGSCQFGEHGQGEGEYFAIVVVATDKALKVGEKLNGIPTGDNATYSKLTIVKRK